MFVSLDLTQDRWWSIQSTYGVSNLIFAGELPLAVPDAIINEIRSREDGDGYVELGLPAGIGPGSAVRLIDGIFENATGTLERIADDRRVAILL
jgi:transcriptional antiterminator RfaH